jgi:hypothetical protein
MQLMKAIGSVPLLAAMIFATGACSSENDEPAPDERPEMLDVLHRDHLDLEVTYDKDRVTTGGATTFASAAIVMKPRSIALRLQMRTAAFPADVLERFRGGEKLTLRVEQDDLQRWVARSTDLEDYNGQRPMWLGDFIDFYVNTDHFNPMCGDTVARAYFKLKTSEGVELQTVADVLDPSKVLVNDARATYDWYGDDECVFEWGIPLVTGRCVTSSGNGKCEHNVDCPRIKKTSTCISVDVTGNVGTDGKTPTASAEGKYGWKYSEEQEMVPVPTYGSCGWQSDPTWDPWPFDNCQCWIDRTAACKAWKAEQTKDGCQATGAACNGGTSCKKE